MLGGRVEALDCRLEPEADRLKLEYCLFPRGIDLLEVKQMKN